MNVQNHFSLPLLNCKNPKPEVFDAEIDSAIEDAKLNNPHFISRQNTYQEIPNFLEFYNLELKEFITHALCYYFQYTQWTGLKRDVDYEIAIKESWLNIDTKGSSQVAHTHPRSQISGVYYHKCDGDEGDIVLYNPMQQIQYGLFPENPRICPGERRLEIQKGGLIAFPSWVQHKTIPNPTDKERISIAFNAYIQEKI